MDEHMLLEGVLRGVLGGRGKRSRKALRYLTSRRGGSFVTPNTLLKFWVWVYPTQNWKYWDCFQKPGEKPAHQHDYGP